MVRSQKGEKSSLALCSCTLVGLTVRKQVTKARNINFYCEFYKIRLVGASFFLASAQTHSLWLQRRKGTSVCSAVTQLLLTVKQTYKSRLTQSGRTQIKSQIGRREDDTKTCQAT